MHKFTRRLQETCPQQDSPVRGSFSKLNLTCITRIAGFAEGRRIVWPEYDYLRSVIEGIVDDVLLVDPIY